MNRSKGDRKPVLVRLTEENRARLEAMRTNGKTKASLSDIINETIGLVKERDRLLGDAKNREFELERICAALKEDNRRLARNNHRREARALAKEILALQKLDLGNVPMWVVNLALRTKCLACDGFMDPLGLMGGAEKCPACRGK